MMIDEDYEDEDEAEEDIELLRLGAQKFLRICCPPAVG